jgi:hypothetical protein
MWLGGALGNALSSPWDCGSRSMNRTAARIEMARIFRVFWEGRILSPRPDDSSPRPGCRATNFGGQGHWAMPNRSVSTAARVLLIERPRDRKKRILTGDRGEMFSPPQFLPKIGGHGHWANAQLIRYRPPSFSRQRTSMVETS